LRLTILITLFICFDLCAQQVSMFGRFSIEFSKGCAPVTISIQEHDNLGMVSRQYFYEPDQIETLDTFHVYSVPGEYQIVQFIGEDIIPKTDTLNFTVLESPQPAFNILNCKENTVAVQIVDTLYDAYEISFNDTELYEYQKTDSPLSFDYPSGSGIIEVKGIYMDSYPTCATTSTSFNLFPVQITQMDSIYLERQCANNIYLNIDFKSFNPFIQLQLTTLFEGVTYTIYQGIITQNQNTFQLPFDLGTEDICVIVNAVNVCDNIATLLEESCISGNLNDTNNLVAWAGFNDKAVVISFEDLGSRQIEAYRLDRNKNSQWLGAFDMFFEDTDYHPNRQPVYSLLLTDTCGQQYDSIVVSAPFIYLSDKNNLQNSIGLEIIEPENGLGVSKTKIIFSNEDQTMEIEYEPQNTYFLPGSLGEIIYIRAEYSYDAFAIKSNIISTTYDTRVFVPSAFTPNNDGNNDELEIFGLPTANFEMKIFDRWGNVIHTALSNPVWSGNIKKQKADAGTYLYQITFELENGKLKTQVGTFTIVNN
jgi:gliding motility-associated-like protein